MIIEKRILKEQSPETYRMVVISDIHAHMDLFEKILNKSHLKAEDYLVVLGDFVEKGNDGLELIHKIAELKKRKNTYILMGNCEATLLEFLCNEDCDSKLVNYLNNTPFDSLLKEAVKILGIDLKQESSKSIQEKLRTHLNKEISILKSLDTAVEFDQFIFVHAGIENRNDWENSSIESMLENQNFFFKGHPLKEHYVVCGHMPVSFYNDHKLDNSLIISHQKRIISIDGGVGVKSFGQLNSLIIEKTDEGYIYSSRSVDPFEKCEVLFPTNGKETDAVKVDWPDFEVDVLGIGTSFSWCRKTITKELIYIKNEFLYENNGHYYCKDGYISSMLKLLPNDEVSLIATYGKYAYIIKDGHVGWTKKDRIKPIKKD